MSVWMENFAKVMVCRWMTWQQLILLIAYIIVNMTLVMGVTLTS